MKDLTVSIAATLSEKQFSEFLQMLRDFDMKHGSGIEFEIVAGAPDISSAEMKAIFDSVKPPMSCCRSFNFKDGTFIDYPEKASN